MSELIGYARTSTIDQEAGLDAQKRDLKAIGVDRIFEEQASSVGHREQLEAAIDYAREGDTIVVTKADRLARSVENIVKLINRLDQKKVGLKILNLGMDTTDPTGRLILNILVSIAQFEREIMLERQLEGIAKAKSEGKFKGRKPLSDDIKNKISEFAANSSKTKSELATELGISRTTLYNYLAKV